MNPKILYTETMNTQPTLLIRPDLRDYRKRLGWFRVVLAIGLTFIVFYAKGFEAWLITVFGVGIILAAYFVYLKRRSLMIEDGQLIYTNAFGKKRTLSLPDIESVRVYLAYIEPSFGYAPRVIISGKQTGYFMSLISLYWNSKDIDALVEYFKEQSVNVEYFDQPTVSRMIAQQFPDSVPYYEKHPVRIALAIVGALFVAITIGVLIVQQPWA